MTGKQLTAKAITYITQQYNGYVVNIIHASKIGIPDLLACIHGQFYGFEIKGYKDTEKKLQSVQIQRIINAGGKAGFVYKIQDIDTIISK